MLSRIRRALKRSRVVSLLGPRQCGKSTLARMVVPQDSPRYFDLEDPASAARLDAPMAALRDLKGWIVIDEIQRRQDLFPILRVLADRKPLTSRFLILGSASPALLRSASESLTGRLEILTMQGFDLQELGMAAQERHWLRGGFPRSYLASNDGDSFQWRRDFIRTVAERDLPLLGFNIPASAMLRFWTMLAHYHGQVWNAAEPARSLGIGETTVRRYLDILTDLFLVRQLLPWHANLQKRQVKAPKIYFQDSGLLHQLLGIRTKGQLLTHPRYGASWEGYVIEEILRLCGPDESYFWGTYNGAELDLLVVKNGKRYGIECKRMDAPLLTPSMKNALRDLNLESIAVVYPGTREYILGDKVKAIPLNNLLRRGKSIFSA